jgi:urease beta subunit
MKKLTRADIVSNEEYSRERDDRRKQIIALKRKRRVQVGSHLSFTFENRETLKYQIQEMMRAERIQDQEKIQFEIDTYNTLIPEPGSLSATMFIEIQEATQIRPTLDRFQGLDHPGVVLLKLGGDQIPAQFEPGHSKEDRISAVHYVMFKLTSEQARNFVSLPAEIQIRHPEYSATSALTEEQREEIAKDLVED